MKFYRVCKDTGDRTALSLAEAKRKIKHNGWNFSEMIEVCKKQPDGKLTLQGSFAYYELLREFGEEPRPERGEPCPR